MRIFYECIHTKWNNFYVLISNKNDLVLHYKIGLVSFCMYTSTNGFASEDFLNFF